MKRILLTSAAALLAACGQDNAPAASNPAAEPAVLESEAPAAAPEAPMARSLDDILADPARAEDAARDQYRHPSETLAFFGVEPGMTVVETLPGGNGWYTKILVPFLGAQGELIGVDYSVEHWSAFGGRYSSEEALEAKRNWVETWTSDWAERTGEGEAAISAFQFGSLPDDMKGTADVVLFIRSLHHLNRFKDKGDFMTPALQDTMDVLKPGGVVGVVQHRGPEGNSDEWANGDQGYLKESLVRAAFEKAGFEFVESSDINANPADQPTNDDMVWRLLPTLGTSRDNPELKAQLEAIGESDRMTLKFRKPM